jgi:CheY-like chemotaxis protein
MLIIKHLVELNHGKMEIESKKNVGTKVKLYFKISDEGKKSAGFVDNNAKAVPDFSNDDIEVKILLVDDTQVNLTVIKGILKRKNYQMIAAENGQEAIDILEENPDINLIVMDRMMPIMDGYEATKIIRSGVGFKNFKNYNSAAGFDRLVSAQIVDHTRLPDDVSEGGRR